MDATRFDGITRLLVDGGTRRGVLGFLATLSLAGTLALILEEDASEARKKHRKKRKNKHKKKCGKPGAKPVKGKCCAGAVRAGTVCQACDVCASGCDFASIQAAIDAADPGATIAICAGIYEEDLLIDIVDQGVTLVGAGDGVGAKDTIVRGTGDLTGVSVVTILSGTVALQNLHITGGVTDAFGGGIFNAGTLAVVGCTVTENTTNVAGGGINNAGSDSGGTLSLIDTIIKANTATDGAGIFNGSGTVTLTRCHISENESLAAGGGIYNFQGTITIDADSHVSGNTATDGGGILNDGGTVNLASSETVTGNTPNNCAGDAVPQCIG